MSTSRGRSKIRSGRGESGDRHPVGHGASLRSRKSRRTRDGFGGRLGAWTSGSPASRAGSSSALPRPWRSCSCCSSGTSAAVGARACRDAVAGSGGREAGGREAARRSTSPAPCGGRGSIGCGRARESTTRSQPQVGRRRRRSSTRSTSPRPIADGEQIVVPGRGAVGAPAASPPAAGSVAVGAARPQLGHARAARDACRGSGR